jgi:alanyl-tRNA synthetase
VEASVNAQIEAQLKLVEHRNIPAIKEALTKVQWSCLEKKWDSVRMIDL